MRKATLAATVGALALVLASCATTTPSGSSSDSNGTFTVGTTDKVTSIDPAGSYDNGSFFVMNQVYGFLTNTKPGDGGTTPSPDIAESAEFTSPTEYTVQLKKNLKFANGHELTSSDVKFSFERQLKIADPNGPSSLLGNLENVATPDDTTVVFTLKVANDQTWAQVLSSPAGPIVDEEVFPADKVLDDDSIVQGKPFAGQYSISSWSKNDLVSYTANADYQGLLGSPVSNTVNMKYYTEASNLRLDIEKANIDVAWRSLSATDIDSLSNNDKLKVHTGPGGEIRYLVFNYATMPFGSKTANADATKAQAVRQAIASLIDRDAVADSVYKGTYTPLWSYIPDGLPGSGTQFKTKYGNGDGKPDAAKAEALLAAAGVTTPIELNIQYSPDHYGPSSGDEYATYKSQLEAGGLFTVKLQSTEWVQYTKDRTADVYPIYQLGWFPDISDADNYLTPFFSKDNFIANHYDNAEVQKLIAEQVGVADKAQREAEFVQIQDLVSTDISTLPLLQGKQIAIAGSQVKGVDSTLDASFKFRLGVLAK